MVRHRHRQPLHAHGGRRREGEAEADDCRAAGAVRHRQAERAALRHPRGHPRRLLGAHPDRACGHQSAVPPAHFPLQGADRLPGAGEHLVQRARRTHREHAGRRLPLPDGQRDRPAGGRQLRAGKVAPGPGAQARLQERLRAGLSRPAAGSPSCREGGAAAAVGATVRAVATHRGAGHDPHRIDFPHRTDDRRPAVRGARVLRRQHVRRTGRRPL
ncbi:hypothetical protein METUNv1_01976 [Methyloversatilis universalis FAM5]|uniref:Uncharacterized protein n=1 Tax=Methyloversatilis universalis (strain ATCC BAA-1314 / DSM 25237 / JCM 13912 / CCUG 52030 / FAM5) TaxID=1000565 RepID=F5RCH2_METUF|nr:hypothetical protein METUNv1_01976 [Methyloversatilis universalis FAM5]